MPLAVGRVILRQAPCRAATRSVSLALVSAGGLTATSAGAVAWSRTSMGAMQQLEGGAGDQFQGKRHPADTLHRIASRRYWQLVEQHDPFSASRS